MREILQLMLVVEIPGSIASTERHAGRLLRGMASEIAKTRYYGVRIPETKLWDVEYFREVCCKSEEW